MNSFVHTSYPARHPGVSRAEAVMEAAAKMRREFDGGKSLAALLLAAVVAALVCVADMMIDTWADGHLLAAWVVLWAVAFAALGLFAGAAKSAAARSLAALDAWSRQVAQARADERLWAIAQRDPRVMAELQAALSRNEVAAPAQATVSPMAAALEKAAHGFEAAFERKASQAPYV